MLAMDKYESESGEQSYEYKMKEVVVDHKAKPSIRENKGWDLTEKICRDGTKIIENIVEREEMTKEEGERLKPKDCHAPRLSGLLKTHKDSVPMTGVASTIGSPFEKLSRYLILILRTIQGRSRRYVKNSRELKEKGKNWCVDKNEILVSYDVKNLYPSIPINEVLYQQYDHRLRNCQGVSSLF